MVYPNPKFFFIPCFHAKHLQQIHWNKIFCRMYGLGITLTMTTSKLHLSIQIVSNIYIYRLPPLSSLCFMHYRKRMNWRKVACLQLQNFMKQGSQCSVKCEQSHSVHFNHFLKDCKIIPIFLSILTSIYDITNFVNWVNGEVSISAKIWVSKSIFMSKIIRIFLNFFFHWRISI